MDTVKFNLYWRRLGDKRVSQLVKTKEDAIRLFSEALDLVPTGTAFFVEVYKLEEGQ